MPDQPRQQIELRKLALRGVARFQLVEVLIAHGIPRTSVIPVLVTGIRLASCCGAC
jgi:hypothetical protein